MNVLPPPEICERARQTRDPRFDGRFFVAVVTTGIYCRPVCPARAPAPENVRIYPSAAAAQEAGFRACLRCKPEAAPRLPEWTLASDTVLRGLRLIDAGFLNDHSVGELAAELAIGARHLDRMFAAELGTSPQKLARLNRVQIAKRLITGSPMPLSQVALCAGFGSQRRFNTEMKTALGHAPSQLRKRGRSAGGKVVGSGDTSPNDGSKIRLRLAVRLPYDFAWTFDFLARRALAGVEEVHNNVYRRLIPCSDGHGWLCVSRDPAGKQDGLLAEWPVSATESAASILRRLRRVFDLDADSAAIHVQLAEQSHIGRWVLSRPGLRVVGAWDGFETTVRAILGQQVSVARATNLANTMVQRYGGGLFPDPQALMQADVAELGMPGQRGRAIVGLARAIDSGDLVLDECADAQVLRDALTSVPGIGPWTASYVGMRVARDPDAFPESDWVVMKVLGETAASCRRLAETWRPWRAYAVMYLWYASSVGKLSAGPDKVETPQLAVEPTDRSGAG